MTVHPSSPVATIIWHRASDGPPSAARVFRRTGRIVFPMKGVSFVSAAMLALASPALASGEPPDASLVSLVDCADAAEG